MGKSSNDMLGSELLYCMCVYMVIIIYIYIYTYICIIYIIHVLHNFTHICMWVNVCV